MFYWHLDVLGLQDFDFGAFFADGRCCKAILMREVESDDACRVVRMGEVDQACLMNLFRSGFLHLLHEGVPKPTLYRVSRLLHLPGMFLMVGYHWYSFDGDPDPDRESLRFKDVERYRKPPSSPDTNFVID